MGSASVSSQVVKANIFLSLLCFCFSLYGCKGCLEEERIALLQLRDLFNYPNGSAFVNEWVGDNCCNWAYLSCGLFHSTYHIVSIELFGRKSIQGLEKWYPNASLFTHFKELQSLYLDENNIGGWIMAEALCKVRNLKVLSLKYNSLDDGGLPKCLTRGLPFLRDISLSGNSLNISSYLLSALCGLRNLRVLDLSSNVLSNGSLPPCMMPTLSSLETLYLSNFPHQQSPNVLIGLQGTTNLQYLDISNNSLNDGSLKALCGAMRNLKTLDLTYSNLNIGEHMPPCLQQNQSLKNLYLKGTFTKNSYGLLRGLICGCKKLITLNLNENGLGDESLPSCLLHNNSMLAELHLSSNNLKGSLGFAAGLCKLRKLEWLDLSMNSLDNITTWTCLSQFTSLQRLDLSQNQISGTIPPFVSNITSLSRLYLSSNKLKGVVFFSMFANLSNLIRIDLSDNRELEVETEFPTWVPSFQLSVLGLVHCKLRNIPRFISNQHYLFRLSLSYNSLQGTIPSWLLYNGSTSLIDLKLRGNHFDGPFPLPSKNETSRLKFLVISDNNIKGQLPINIHLLFPNLVFFNMSGNKLEGCIPPSFGKLINLQMLDLSNNQFIGQVPHELTQNSTSLALLLLSNNYLHAMARVSNMTHLQTLSLDGNIFTAPFPITPSTVPLLQLLDISGNSISGYLQHWLPTAFPNLVALLMRGNHFVGYLPTSLCQMQQLRFLDVSYNNLFGPIPSCLNNITSWLEESNLPLSTNMRFSNYIILKFKIHFATKGKLYSYEGLPLGLMTGIDFSLNQLSDHIPFQLGELRALRSLNFSHNSLSGNIPESFKGLENLESLDLSHNKLVGKIPLQMIQLFFLSNFIVAFNQLSGKIPYEKNFATFTKDSYIGNEGLCGPPTEVNCSSPQPHHINEYREGDGEQSLIDNDLFFYSCVAISYLLGFWAVVAPLLLFRNWRRKYYRVVDVDGCLDWCSDKLF